MCYTVIATQVGVTRTDKCLLAVQILIKYEILMKNKTANNVSMEEEREKLQTLIMILLQKGANLTIYVRFYLRYEHMKEDTQT